MTDADISRRVIWLTRLLGVGGLALMGVTWKLWTPQDVFPRVPLFWWAPPHWLDLTALAVTVIGLVALVVSPVGRARSASAAVTACGFALLFLSDQHRLQPWAWQFFILATVLALGDERTVFYGWRWLVVSIYFYSAVSKFDMAFAESVSQQFSGLLLSTWPSGPTGWTASIWNWRTLKTLTQLAWYLAFALPLGELCTAALLAWPRTRRLGLWSSLLMHALLLAWLGPFGLNHKSGVLLWNGFFLMQNLMLFRRAEEFLARSWPWRYGSLQANIAKTWMALVMAWPVFQPWGYCDPWLGWAVYVPPFEEAQMVVSHGQATLLPEEIQTHLAYPWCGNDYRVLVDENRMSLASLGVPVYPHPRFQIGVYIDLYQRHSIANATDLTEDGFEISRAWVEVDHRAGRLASRAWSSDQIGSYDELLAYARTFRLNAFPESYYRRLAAERRAAAK